MLEENENKFGKMSRQYILNMKWAKMAKKMLSKNDGWRKIKIKKNPIEKWKKLLIKAS